MIPLALIGGGEKAEIIDFIKQGRGILSRLRDMGFFAGKIVEVISNEGCGLMLLKVDDTRVAIGRGMAMKIMVRRLQ